MKKQTWKMHFYKGVPCTWEHEPYDEERETIPLKRTYT